MSNHRADIDGLRALAILPVLLYHFNLGCPGGYIGVDVFFVISGYLISSLILKEMDTGTFALTAFWERRIRRLLPALAAVVLACVAAGWLWYLPVDFQNLGKSVTAQALLISNYYFYQNATTQGGYFAITSETQTLLHTWTLAVEEQFYLLFPPLLIGLSRLGRRFIWPALGGLAAASFAWSIPGVSWHPSATFYLLPSRAWELLLGALLAMGEGKWTASDALRDRLGWLGFIFIITAVFTYDNKTPFPGLAAALPCGGAALIIFSSELKLSAVGRMLACRPLVYIGLMSYSLYLWHWPILVWAKYYYQHLDPNTGEMQPMWRAGLAAGSFVPALLSWKYVETPVRKRRWLPARSNMFKFALACFVLTLGCGVALFQSHGWPGRFHGRALGYLKSRGHREFLNETSLESARNGRLIEIGSAEPGTPVELLVWGDSHAIAVTPVLAELCRREHWRGLQAAHGATAPILDYVSTASFSMGTNSPSYNRAILDFIAHNHVRKVVMAAHWSSYLGPDLVEHQLLATVRAVAATGAQVYFLKDVPLQNTNLPRITDIAILHDEDLEGAGISPAEYDRAVAPLEATYTKVAQAGATVLDPSKYLINSRGYYGFATHDTMLYWDYQHLTVEGAERLAPMFGPVFASP
jgi:peptidoglycan/LPS O-acetylase OafA/YrhL